MATWCNETKKTATEPVFPLTRFCYYGSFRHYYPFGNVPAEDFLENCVESVQPSVLILGCGDMRSCFYSLWKNFDFSISNAPRKFRGVDFVINDYSAAIIARNLVILFLCLQLPEEVLEKKKWLSAMWAIWYCHELYPCHVEMLDSTLKTLLSFSDSIEQWSSMDNPLYSHVQFTSSFCLSEVAKMWNMWVNKTVMYAQ